LLIRHSFNLEWLAFAPHLYNSKPFHMKKAILADIITCLFILLFVYAALSKMLDYRQFRVQVGQSPLLTSYAGQVVWAVPALEIIIALLLAMKSTRLAGLYSSFFLMMLFTAYIIAITRFSDYIPCSCGGILQKMNWNQHMVFNICFVIMGGAATFLLRNDPSPPRLLK
jgi:zinc transporter ZupT